ncbi:MAG TPA: hypothetical protein VMI06_05980, partial [Terriglobia bacterium]|nr:hypothetical protein [Terriglobia bacterium]
MKIRCKANRIIVSGLAFCALAIESPAGLAKQAPEPSLSTQQVQADLSRLYRVSARIHGLLEAWKTVNSKMPNTTGSSSQQKVAAVNLELQTLEAL